MPKEFSRPADVKMLEDREAAGLWKAIALSKEIGESQQSLGLDVVLKLHERIFSEVRPEIAGRFRKTGEDVKRLNCIEPPLGIVVHEKMHLFEKDLYFKLAAIGGRPDPKHNKQYRQWVENVFDLAAWTQHQLVAIHPFCEGNGRVARLMTNVVLRRFHMPPTDVKIESDDKKKYLTALCQIDNYGDYESLRSLLLRGSLATMNKEKEKRQKKQAVS